MIAIDTNILVRLLVNDNAQQFSVASKLMKHDSIHVPDSVVLETEWVLRSGYRFSPKRICEALRQVLGLKNIHVQDKMKWAEILKWHEAGMDFADAVHLGNCESIPELKTYDKDFISKAKGLTNCKVSAP